MLILVRGRRAFVQRRLGKTLWKGAVSLESSQSISPISYTHDNRNLSSTLQNVCTFFPVFVSSIADIYKPYIMQININNKTNNTLTYLGAAFYDEDGNVRRLPKNIPPKSIGDGGSLEKVGGGDGLFGLVAYATPDPAKTLVIYIEMSATAGTLNHCFVRMSTRCMMIQNLVSPNARLA